MIVPSRNSATDGANPCHGSCTELNRRHLLFGAGAAFVSIALPGFGPLVFSALKVEYPRRSIAKLSQLKADVPETFRYPWDHSNCQSVLLKLEEEAAGGIGPDKNIVAFNALCTHMGAEIPSDQFKTRLGIAGPCPMHWTTFDLTRHGMVVSGHATQGLPQVVLELNGDDIVAVGVLGLLFGFHDNTAEPKA